MSSCIYNHHTNTVMLYTIVPYRNTQQDLHSVKQIRVERISSELQSDAYTT